jgi:lipopolysaccharide exporter
MEYHAGTPYSTIAISTLLGYAGYAARAVISFGYTLILARLLGPKPFGPVAAAWVVVGFANLLADGGFELALVQAPELFEADIRFAFTMQLAIGFVLTIGCIALAPFIGVLFHDPEITMLLRWMSLVFVLQSLGQVSTALLKRQLDFKWLHLARVGSTILGYGGIGILLAFSGQGVWSLIFAQLVESAIYSSLIFARVRHAIKPSLSTRSLRLARFGATVTVTNLMNWCISNFDNAFAGRGFGPEGLGLYSQAFNTASAPADAVVGSWQQVLVASCWRAFPVHKRPLRAPCRSPLRAQSLRWQCQEKFQH